MHIPILWLKNKKEIRTKPILAYNEAHYTSMIIGGRVDQ